MPGSFIANLLSFQSKNMYVGSKYTYVGQNICMLDFKKSFKVITLCSARKVKHLNAFIEEEKTIQNENLFPCYLVYL